MKERDKKLAGLPYNQALLEQQQKSLFEQAYKCPENVKNVLNKVIGRLKRKASNCSPKMAKVYSADLECYNAIKEAAMDGRRTHAIKFWNTMDDESKSIFHDCCADCPNALAYFDETPVAVEQEETVESSDKFPPSEVRQCMMLLQSEVYKADPELAYDIFGEDLVNFCKSMAGEKVEVQESADETNGISEEAEDNTNVFKAELPLDSEHEELSSQKWALQTKEEDEVELPKDVLSDLEAYIKELKMRIDVFQDPGYYLEKQDLEMYVSQLESLEQLHTLLKEKTVVNVQKAMIYLTSLQTSIFQAVPLSTRQYLMKGYNHKSLLDYFREKK